MKKMLQLLLLALSISLIGCTPSRLSGDSYSREDALSRQQVRYATIVQLRAVSIEGTKSGVGGAAGAAVGGIGGSATGNGKGAAVATILGAVAGGIIGAKAEEGLTKTPAVEITLRYEDGEEVAIVQADEKSTQFRIGERVRVLTLNGRSRVAY